MVLMVFMRDVFCCGFLDGDAFVKSKDPYSTLFHVSFYNIFYVDSDTVEELHTVYCTLVVEDRSKAPSGTTVL